MKKIFSILIFVAVVCFGFYSYFSVFVIDIHIDTITPNYMEINSSDLMKLEKEKIAFLAESLAKDHIFLKNERQKVDSVIKKQLLILFFITLTLSLVFLFISFKPKVKTKL